MGRVRGVIGVGVLVAAGIGSVPIQSPPPRYSAINLACAAFVEQVETTIHNQSGRAVVQDVAGRGGVLVLRARAEGDSLGIEAWYDSVAVWRGQGAEVERPDTEGMLGGRYRGTLTPTGQYKGVAVPFIPDEVLEIADLTPVMDDFLPPLPRVPLAAGRDLRDSAGRIQRIADQAGIKETLERYQWTRTYRVGNPAERDSTSIPADTLSVDVEERGEEQGTLVWSRTNGPLSWTRHVIVDARIPAKGRVKRNVYSRVDQTITVRRIGAEGRCPD